MKILSVELTNWRQHKHKAATFGYGLNAIFGRNGSGKSNLLQAIIFALTGYTDGRREDSLRYGTTSGSVDLVFRLDTTGVVFRVVRNLHNPDVTLYEKRGEEFVQITRKSAEAREFLESTGFTVDLATRVLAIPQEKMTAMLSESAGKSNELFQKIFSLQPLRRIRDKLRVVIRDAEVKQADLVSRKNILTDQLEARKVTLQTFQSVPERAVLESQLQILNQKIQDVDTQLGQIQGADYLRLMEVNTRNKLQALDKDLCLPEPKDPCPEFDAEKAVSEVSRFTTLISELTVLQSQCVRAESIVLPEPVDPKILELASNAYKEAMDVAFDLRKQRDQLVLFRDTGRCPTCGAQRQVSPEAIASLESHLRESESHVSVAESRYTLLKTQADKYTATEIARNTATTAYQDAAKKFGLENESPERLRCRAEEMAVEYEGRKNLLEISLSKRSAYMTEHMRWENSQQYLRAQRDELVEQLQQAHTHALWGFEAQATPQELNMQRSVLEKEHAGVREQLIQRIHYESSVAQYNDTLHELNTVTRELGEYHPEILNTVQELYSWLAPTEFPQRVASTLYQILSKRINVCLEEFEAPYRISIKNTGEFACTREDGVVQSSARLSGGEKMIVSIAFRLALHDLFSANDSAGFLILDEPTTFLDEANRGILADVLKRLKTSKHYSAMQIFVVTHEDSLRPLFDNVTDV